MKWAAIAVGVVVGFVLVVVAVGYMLPRDHVAGMSAKISAAPDAVWAALVDRAAFPTWRADVQRVELLPDAPNGPSWREHANHDAITYVAEVQEAPHRLVARIADKNLPYGGAWEYRIEADGAGSTVTVIERGSVYNPIFRFISRFFMGHTSTIDKFLRALGKKFGTEPTPAVIAIEGETRGV